MIDHPFEAMPIKVRSRTDSIGRFNGKWCVSIMESAEHPGFFYVLRAASGRNSTVNKRPVAPALIATMLRVEGIDPASLQWEQLPGVPVSAHCWPSDARLAS